MIGYSYFFVKVVQTKNDSEFIKNRLEKKSFVGVYAKNSLKNNGVRGNINARI